MVNMEGEKNWYVVYTRPRWEKKAAQLLTKIGIESYCPLYKSVRQWSDRKKVVDLPLFTSYVFIYASKWQHSAIRDTAGVINFIYWLGKPAIIKDAEIEVIKTFLATHENVKAEQVQMNVRDTVRILAGPLSMKEGKIIEIRKHSVRVSLPSLGYVLTAEIAHLNIELVSSFKNLAKHSN